MWRATIAAVVLAVSACGSDPSAPTEGVFMESPCAVVVAGGVRATYRLRNVGGAGKVHVKVLAPEAVEWQIGFSVNMPPDSSFDGTISYWTRGHEGTHLFQVESQRPDATWKMTDSKAVRTDSPAIECRP